MSASLRQAWRARRWYDLPLLILGLLFALLGGTFFVIVSSVGAPLMPYGGLAVALFGLWVGFIRPLRRRESAPQSVEPG